MKKYVSLVLLCILYVALITIGCSNQVSYEDAAKEALTTVYTYPNQALNEFYAGENVADAEALNKLVTEILGDGFDEAYAKQLAPGPFISEMALSADRGIQMIPKEITLQGEEKNYSYTVIADFTDADGNISSVSISGRIQFNDKGKINFISWDRSDGYPY